MSITLRLFRPAARRASGPGRRRGAAGLVARDLRHRRLVVLGVDHDYSQRRVQVAQRHVEPAAADLQRLLAEVAGVQLAVRLLAEQDASGGDRLAVRTDD